MKRMIIREQEPRLLFTKRPVFTPVTDRVQQLCAGVAIMFRVLAKIIPALIKAQVVKSSGETTKSKNNVDKPHSSIGNKGYNMFWIIEEIVRNKSKNEDKSERNSFELEWNHLEHWYFDNHVLR